MAEIENWQYYCYDEIGSTNDEIKKFCLQKEKKVVVRALSQTAGRGRRGRKWVTKAGNLFFSVALEFDLKNLGQLVIISSLSLAQSVKFLSAYANVKLKWPNDVLLDGKKMSGILMEKAEGEYIIVGIGVNVAESPKESTLLYPATSLAENGINTDAENFLQIYLHKFNENLQKYSAGEYESLRSEWMDFAKDVGDKIVIKQEQKQLKGIFAGIDEQANLLLQCKNETIKVMVGDVFYETKG